MAHPEGRGQEDALDQMVIAFLVYRGSRVPQEIGDWMAGQESPVAQGQSETTAFQDYLAALVIWGQTVYQV